MSDLVQGIYITIIGMSLVFATLGLILLLMVVLGRLFPERAAADQVGQHEGTEDERERKRRALAIGAALALALEEPAPLLFGDGTGADASVSGWVAAGRARQLHGPLSREKAS